MQLDGELTLTGKTVSMNENVSLGATHSIHLRYYKSVTIQKDAWSEEDLGEIRRSQDVSRNAQKAVVQLGRDGIARFAYVNDEELLGFTRLESQIPQKTAFNEGKISQAQQRFYQEVVKLLRGKLEGVATVDMLSVYAQSDVLQAFRVFIEALQPNPFPRLQINYTVSRETALSRIIGETQSSVLLNVFEEFRARLEQNLRYFVGPDAVECIRQNPTAFSDVLVLKSMQSGDDRDSITDFLERVHKKIIQAVNVHIIPDRSELGQQLRNYGGIIGLLKYDVYLENIDKKEGQEFVEWDQFDDIAE